MVEQLKPNEAIINKGLYYVQEKDHGVRTEFGSVDDAVRSFSKGALSVRWVRIQEGVLPETVQADLARGIDRVMDSLTLDLNKSSMNL